MERLKTVSGEEFLDWAAKSPPYGPGFSAQEISVASSMTVYTSSETDPEDAIEFVLNDEGGNPILSRMLKAREVQPTKLSMRQIAHSLHC